MDVTVDAEDWAVTGGGLVMVGQVTGREGSGWLT